MAPTTTSNNPGYPVPNPTISFWLQGTRSSPLLGHRTTETLPENAEVAIIGSGISGASVAYFLFKSKSPPKSVVILEAREACYGATGRNGGNCGPDCFWGYPSYKKELGKEQALKVLQNEMDTLNLMTEIIEKEGIDCDFWRGRSYQVAVDDEYADQLSEAYHNFVNDGGPVEGIVKFISDPQEAKQLTRTPSAICAASSPAGSLWPYKFVAHLLNICIKDYGLNLQTNTTVRSVIQDSERWTLKTDRGDIHADKVVYATNAWTATLLPEFLGGIVPNRGQCAAIVPTKAYSGSTMVKCTMLWRQDSSNVDYMMQRPKDGIIIVGGRRWVVPEEEIVGQADDSVKLPQFTKYLKKILPTHLENWGSEVSGEGLLCDWTGIRAFTPEMVPYVGALPDKANAFICAGHSGHGMARVVSCAKGLTALIQGATWESTGLPGCFQPTPDRMAKF
ncbi:fad dependent oxidoreductase [Moniliophthora roreri MCA 2997]|uniref:Fad dependent oxidoreductase n=2 Tax=Moniliophthora roreri TaxID=221103 RepID=V2X3U0_MONRO|nr:fad dependent oxidoreductase [Moniliophthora roreri MCA 2997]KAI3601338.1 fad dependent oxidoreductase [Moniliophthora roreri]